MLPWPGPGTGAGSLPAGHPAREISEPIYRGTGCNTCLPFRQSVICGTAGRRRSDAGPGREVRMPRVWIGARGHSDQVWGFIGRAAERTTEREDPSRRPEARDGEPALQGMRVPVGDCLIQNDRGSQLPKIPEEYPAILFSLRPNHPGSLFTNAGFPGRVGFLITGRFNARGMPGCALQIRVRPHKGIYKY